MGYLELKQLVDDRKVTVVFIGGTTRSGSTITQVVFSYLVDSALHQPFMGALHKQGKPLNSDSQLIDSKAGAFETACDLIVSHILEVLQQKDHAIVLVKEVSGFFTEELWMKWLEIPQKFLFTLRDPHLQYLSWLALITDILFEGNGSLLSDREFIFKNCSTVESTSLRGIRPGYDGYEGTTLSYQRLQWDNLIQQIQQTRVWAMQNQKEMAILDLILLQKDPDYVITKTLSQLGWNYKGKDLVTRDSITRSQDKVFDIRGTARPAVQKARGSDSLEPLKSGQDVSPDRFSPASQAQILQLIPSYLDALYASEHVGMLSLEQLDEPVVNNDPLKLENTNPFVAYAVAKFHEQSHNDQPHLISQRILETQGKILNHEVYQSGSFDLTRSFEEVDRYLNSASSVADWSMMERPPISV